MPILELEMSTAFTTDDTGPFPQQNKPSQILIRVFFLRYVLFRCKSGGRNSVAGIANCCGLDGLEIESWWRIDCVCPPSLLYNGCLVFPGGEAAGAWC
jgi:hypothetical protein